MIPTRTMPLVHYHGRISEDGIMPATDPIELTPGVLACIVPGEPFAARPALRLDSLALALPGEHDDELYESQLAATRGSAEWLWDAAEYWRFDAVSSEVVRIVAALPADNAPERALEAWADAPTVAGPIQRAAPQDFTRRRRHLLGRPRGHHADPPV